MKLILSALLALGFSSVALADNHGHGATTTPTTTETPAAEATPAEGKTMAKKGKEAAKDAKKMMKKGEKKAEGAHAEGTGH